MTLADFLALLDQHHTSYTLGRVRDSVMVYVAIPGERWEIEFMDAGGIEVEKFVSDGSLIDGLSGEDLARLIED